MNHQVIVGNIGVVYSGSDRAEAMRKFDEYKWQSQFGRGRASGEQVTWITDDSIYNEHIPDHSVEVTVTVKLRVADVDGERICTDRTQLGESVRLAVHNALQTAEVDGFDHTYADLFSLTVNEVELVKARDLPTVETLKKVGP